MSKSIRTLLNGSRRPAPSCKRLHCTPHNKPIKFNLHIADGPNNLPALASAVQNGQVAALDAQQIIATVGHVSQKVLSKVKKALLKAGFTVAEFDPCSRLLSVEGKARLVRKCFGATLNEYRDSAGNVYTGRNGSLSLPKSWGISSHVTGIHGIDQRPKAKPRLQRDKGRTSDHLSRSWNAKAVADHYGVPQNKLGAGFACGFVSLGGGLDPAVVARANARLGLPAPKITIITVDGATNSPSGSLDGADGENYLDSQCQAAVAPLADQIMAIGPNSVSGFAKALLAIAQHALKPRKISISWGANEDTTWTDDDRALMDQALQTCVVMGIVVYCAAGDDGSSDGAGDKKSHCDYPSSSPWNVGCSGVFDDGKSVKAWKSSFGGATGGGVSAKYLSYTDGQLALQKSAIKLPVNADSKKPGRIVGDIAGIADPSTGIEVMGPDGSVEVIGGTSAVSPFHAGAGVCIDSELGKPMPDLNTIVYKLAAAGQNVCVPVTVGSNGAYSCKPGDVINAVCGLGPIDYKKLFAALKAG